MSSSKNFKTSQDKKVFNSLLKEFGSRIFFLTVLLGLAALWAGLFRPQQEVYRCDAEYVRQWKGASHYYCDDNFFSGGTVQTDEAAHSGFYSLKLSPEKRFGFDFSISKLEGNETITASFWRKGKKGHDAAAGIVLDITGLFWKKGTEIVERHPDNWEKIQIEMKPQANMKNKDLHIYIWNNGKDVFYIDDLKVKVKRNDIL